jgi:hypothetical protein
MGARFLGAGAVQLYDPSLSMLYFPASSADVKACGVPTTETWTTTASTLQEIRSCWLDLPRAGFAYVSATASVGLSSGGAYEGLFRIGVDDINGLDSSSRWVNVYPDSSDGSDEAIASSLLTEVTAGSHTFFFSGMRSNGAGTVKINNSNLSVLYFPAPNATLNVCGTAASDDWNNATDTFSVIRGCTLNVPRDSFAFVDASASAKLDFAGAGNEWEGHFRLGIDNINGASATDRWVNVYNDGGNGTDRSVAQSMLFDVSRGPHTFAFVGRRFAGGGTVRLVAPILSVLVPGDRAFLPAIRR